MGPATVSTVFLFTSIHHIPLPDNPCYSGRELLSCHDNPQPPGNLILRIFYLAAPYSKAVQDC